MIATALERVMRRGKPEPAWRRAFAESRRVLVGAIIMGVLAIGVTFMIFRWRSNEPATNIAHFDNLTWREVERGGETTVPLILKDPVRERGRKLCVRGGLTAIKQTTVNGRDVHVGTLSTADGAIRFIALRSTRTVVERRAVQFCGVAHGEQIVGLFDLAENR
jgi:hypothetical protein